MLSRDGGQRQVPVLGLDDPAAGVSTPDVSLATPGRRAQHLQDQLKFEDTGDSLRMAPLQEHHLQSLLTLCNLDDAHDLLMVTILYTGHDGSLRAGEIVSGLRPRDVIWGAGRTSMSVRFARSKTLQVFFKNRLTLNAVSLMRRWFDLNQLGEPTLQFFPRRISRTRSHWS